MGSGRFFAGLHFAWADRGTRSRSNLPAAKRSFALSIWGSESDRSEMDAESFTMNSLLLMNDLNRVPEICPQLAAFALVRCARRGNLSAEVVERKSQTLSQGYLGFPSVQDAPGFADIRAALFGIILRERLKDDGYLQA